MKLSKIIFPSLLFIPATAFAYFTGLVISTEVLPSLKLDTLNVKSSTMILNHVWEANQIYILITLYAFASVISFVSGFKLLQKHKSLGQNTQI